MAEVKWIKIVTDVFDNRKIKMIESMPDGDTILIVWFKLLCLAGQTNDGGSIYFTPEIPFTSEMLASYFNRPLTTIRLAMDTFQNFGMIEIEDDFIKLSSWSKYQNVEGMEKIREQTRQRVAKHRELKALEECNVTCNVTVTDGNATDKNRIDKSKNKSKSKREKPTHQKNGEYGHVLLTDDQLARLNKDFGKYIVDKTIKDMDEWIQLKGKSPYKDFNLAIRKWINKDSANQQQEYKPSYLKKELK